MSVTRPASLPAPLPATATTQLAKAALRRLALAHAEPTPENYARAYDEELGVASRPVLPPRSQALLERIAGALREIGAVFARVDHLLARLGRLAGAARAGGGATEAQPPTQPPTQPSPQPSPQPPAQPPAQPHGEEPR